MKGIAHFAAGVALASFFPSAVRAGAAGNPLPFIAGGVCGLLPDTLDFRFARFLERHAMEVAPDPLDPDPELLAESFAGAVRHVQQTGRPCRVKYRTARLGADRWLQYSLVVDPAASAVCAEIGPVVNTSRRAVGEAAATGRTHAAPVPCPVRLDYRARTTIDILDGPSFELAPDGSGGVRIRFIPWHRAWSHSFVTALLPASLLGLAAGPAVGAIAWLAWSAHVALDQAGFLGSACLWPLVRRRFGGLHLLRSEAPVANFAAVWGALFVTLWNLSRLTPGCAARPTLAHVLLYGVAAPVLGVWLLVRRRDPEPRRA